MSAPTFGLHTPEEIERFRRLPPEEKMRLTIALMREVDRVFLSVPEEERLRRSQVYNRTIKEAGTQRLLEKFRSLP